MRRVVVTGLGAVTPLGVGIQRTWSRLLAGDTGISSVAMREPKAQWHDLASTVAGVVPRGEKQGQWRASDWLGASDQRRMSTFAQYAVAACDMALEDARWRGPLRPEQKDATGVCVGSGIGNLDELYDSSRALDVGGHRSLSPLFVPKILINMAAGHISLRHGFRGPNHSATTACTTGAHSIGDASRFIAFGDADVMIAGGAEACIHPLAFAGFGRTRSLSTSYNDDPGRSCRPFDADRDGFVISEGAAVCVLEELEHATSRGARIYAELRGYGSSGDAHHMTAPRRDGAGAYLAMRRALSNAKRRPADVGYINAHATGTRVGDAAEAAAIRSLMLGPEGVSVESQVTVSSTKAALGHLLGGAGAVEALIAVLAVHEGIVPPTLNLLKPDVGAAFNFVPLKAQERRVDVAVSNSFGFGGTNSSLTIVTPRVRLLTIASKASNSFRKTPFIPPLHTILSRLRWQLQSLALVATRASTTPTRPRRSLAMQTTRRLSGTGAARGLLGGYAKAYQVIGAAERIFKACSAPADYAISEDDRRNDGVEKLEDGEELGKAVVPNTVWHKTFKLPPSFSTWSHVTMLHLYLVNARVRCFDHDVYRNWQQQLVDQFFFECEKKMHLDHNLTSSTLRQRYLKDVFVQWRGLLLAYDEGLIKGDAILASAVWRNLFKGSPGVDPRALMAIVGWMRSSLVALEALSDQSFTSQVTEILARPVDVFLAYLGEPTEKRPPDVAKGSKSSSASSVRHTNSHNDAQTTRHIRQEQKRQSVKGRSLV
ncbi:hypothetical protein L249_6453 [Ophiocordyceps polyrhachis-furcata BCC 54312]|uniref:beta-ketoacyl-[acyl-carrier-protein] synthase I n=1 Tax=Ophiocordyceps polyrhachis-furcata BCC 54312 TaxID=1330021 RepID=A0A367LJU5_9HYPO|nr:hypothetical protein L249_6453 [Ophiocordyceps polyrhachis-furcata BCC 54312]